MKKRAGLCLVCTVLVGVALAIFLGFRNSASYDRYWEARKLWGKLLTDSRNAARQCISFMPGVRILRMVMKKLMPLSVVPRPETCRPQM